METHTVDVADLLQWKSEQKVLFASSTKENKQLFANLNGGFEVFVNGILVKECIQPYVALETYNLITE